MIQLENLAHIDQTTLILRYVSPDTGKPVERFLTYLDTKIHTGENQANAVVSYLENSCRIDFSQCRGQSYDNAANMSGAYKGMQKKIRDINESAIFIPCAGHSLNLVGQAAVDSCLEAVRFFSIIQELYVFFSASPRRWSLLDENMKKMAKLYISNDCLILDGTLMPNQPLLYL